MRTKNLIRCYISSPSHKLVSFIFSLVCHLGRSDKYSSNHVDHSLSMFVKKERQNRTQWKQKTDATLSVARTHARTYTFACAQATINAESYSVVSRYFICYGHNFNFSFSRELISGNIFIPFYLLKIIHYAIYFFIKSRLMNSTLLTYESY